MTWFKYLKEKGHFDPANNPAPIKVEAGYQVPYWSVLDYLEKLALSITQGENTELTPELIQIIKDVSDNPVDNYHTWYHFIKIITLLPNEAVTRELLNYIPVWVKSQFDTMLQTQEICSKLLPKFISEQITNPDKEKAETILYHLFSLNNNSLTPIGDGYSTSQYQSPFYLYFLTHDLLENNLLRGIAKQSSLTPVLKLMESINLLLRDVPVTAQVNDGEITYTFELLRSFNSLTIKILKENNGVESLTERIIENYLDYSASQLNTVLEDIYKIYSIPIDLSEQLDKRLRFNLENDMISAFGYNGIKDLDEEKYSGFNEALNTFSLILREWLTILAQENNTKKIEVIFQILKIGSQYQLPFFLRMKLFIIAQNWDTLKDWFIELIIGSDKLGLFSNEIYQAELYYLLSQVAGKIQPKDVVLIKTILEQGPIVNEYYNPNPDMWRHRWLDALQNQIEFSNDYKLLQEKLQINKNYNEEGKINIRVGNISPFSKDELLEMSPDVLLEHLINFKDKDRWEDPTIEGFAEQLCSAVEEDPGHFTELLTNLVETKYIYAYNIIYGFSKAAKNGKLFAWPLVLEFIDKYISTDKFISGGLAVEDGLGVNQDWVYGNIASLINEGSQDNEVAYNNDQLSNVKLILLEINNRVPSIWRDKIMDDYVTASINTTSGRILQATILYSLKYARAVVNKDDKWERDIKEIYTQALSESHMEAFTYLSMYMPQLMFLDEKWLKDQLAEVWSHDQLCHAAFMDGLAFIRPLSKNYYELVYPVYEEYSTNNTTATRRNRTLIDHLVAYYIWDYEESTDDILIYKLLNNQPGADVLNRLIVTLSRFFKDKNIEPELEVKILHLWSIINLELKRFTDKKDLDTISNIVYMNDLLTKLTKENVSLVEDNIELISIHRNSFYFIDNLINWSKTSDPHLIANLLRNMKFSSYFDKEKIRYLIEYLYSNGQQDIAFECQIKFQ